MFFVNSGLKKILQEKMHNEIPVISVISIMGTTEESAVDPLEDIFEIRKELSTLEKVYLILTPVDEVFSYVELVVVRVNHWLTLVCLNVSFSILF